jgi:C-terminal processing protease CtpA/Prc
VNDNGSLSQAAAGRFITRNGHDISGVGVTPDIFAVSSYQLNAAFELFREMEVNPYVR